MLFCFECGGAAVYIWGLVTVQWQFENSMRHRDFKVRGVNTQRTVYFVSRSAGGRDHIRREELVPHRGVALRCPEDRTMTYNNNNNNMNDDNNNGSTNENHNNNSGNNVNNNNNNPIIVM